MNDLPEDRGGGSKVDALVADLRRHILDRQIPPGATLTEAALVGDFKVARPTARSAILILVQRGLLTQEPNKPAAVVQQTDDYVRDLFRARRAIELEAVRVITRKRLRVPSDAGEAIDRLASLRPDAPNHFAVEADLSFHRVIVGAIGSIPLLKLFDTLEWEIQLSMTQTARELNAQTAADDHQRILETLHRREWAAARDEMLSHLKSASRDIAGRMPRQ